MTMNDNEWQWMKMDDNAMDDNGWWLMTIAILYFRFDIFVFKCDGQTDRQTSRAKSWEPSALKKDIFKKN